jgi:hypothetical protein
MDLRELQHDIAELLDKVAVRAEASRQVGQQLRDREETWRAARGDEAGVGLLRKAQGLAGMVGASADDPMALNRAYRELLDFKLECRIDAARS